MALIDVLLDTSVLTRVSAPAILERLRPLLLAGRAAVCSIVVAEVLRGTRSPEHFDQTAERLQGFFSLPTPDDAWERVLQVQAALGAEGRHQSIKIPDLLIAAVAERNRVTVIHYDEDFDAIAAVSGQPCEWVVPRASIS